MHNPKHKPGDRVVRHPRSSEMAPIKIPLTKRTVSFRGVSSPMALVYGFLLLAALGGIFLLLPISSTAPGITAPLSAFFTAISAVTVTGLVVTNTATAWTGFGQAVILILIFLGGLGFITGAAFLFLVAGQRLGLGNRLIIREGLGGEQLGGIAVQVRRIVIIAVSLQVAGSVLLFLDFLVFGALWEGIRWYEALWQAVFHSVASFNNSGFDIFPDHLVGGSSLQGMRSNYFTIGVIVTLVLVGGISQSIIADVWKKRKWTRLTLDSKMALTGTVLLTFAGIVLFGLFNWNNVDTVGNAPLGEKVASAIFEAVSSRTAGYSTIDYGKATNSQTIFTMFLMIVGGTAGSTAGGIKVNTAMIILAAIITTARGRRRVTAFAREIPASNVQIALAIGLVAIVIIASSVMLLSLVQPGLGFRETLFEVVSAFGTLGLSQGVTERLNGPGSALIAFLMLVGRLGPLTFSLLILGRYRTRAYKFAQERVRIG